MKTEPLYRPSCAWLALLLLFATAAPSSAADPNDAKKVSLKEPSAYRVYQRDEHGQATIPITLDDETAKDWEILGGRVGRSRDGDIDLRSMVPLVAGKLVLPTGGPYTLKITVHKKDNRGYEEKIISPVFVGDLWVLAGQSNMEGVGDLVDVTPLHDGVMALGMDGKWVRAEEPLHWLIDSPDPVHSGNPADRARRSQEVHKRRRKGAGLGLPFGVAMVEKTGVPVGLVACAHGGTSMAQWSPALKDKEGASLYGSMLRQVRLAGGKVKGVLWYQGESDSLGDKAKAEAYPKVFADFIAAVRRDFGQPDLPFYLVQIGRFINPADPKGWNAVQEAQRRIPERIPNTAVVSVIDLELDDLIHVGTQGLKRTGKRLAGIALRELFSHPAGRTTPTFDSAWRLPDNTLRVKFKGVNRTAQPGRSRLLGLRPERQIAGFSIRKADGSAIPLIFEAKVDPQAVDTVILKLTGPVPKGAQLWYGYGLDPYCNLTDHEDMAVPVFGPVALDEVE